MAKALFVAGTRPNFIKIAPLMDEFKRLSINCILVHTGQHYDAEMSRVFFDELGLPKPDINLGVGSGTYCEQIGKIMMALERVLADESPDIVIVVGDVNSTLAGALAAKQLQLKVAHVEAGLRSFDLKMPEEINRMLTDRISDFLFTTEKSANRNLLKEGVSEDKIFFAGNVMIDTLLKHKEKSSESKILDKLNIRKDDYCVLTLHRPSNVDDREGFKNILSMLDVIQEKIKIIFPMHPRTKKNAELFGLDKKINEMKNLIVTDPLGYLDFLCLMGNSMAVLTDSGGMQEETTVLGIPCITLRESTERPVTAEQGTNLLVSTDKDKVIVKLLGVINNKIKAHKEMPELWDGKAAERIAAFLIKRLDDKNGI